MTYLKRYFSRITLTLFGLIAVVAMAADTGMDAERLARIPRRMNEFVDAGKTAGAVTLVARHGEIVTFEAVGYQDLEAKTPMRKDTIFRIASLTKPVTCAGIMALVDDGRLAVMDPVEKYLPEFKGQKVNRCSTVAGPDCPAVTPSRPINILDLMTHTSGLQGGFPAPPGGEEPADLATLVAPGGKTILAFEPGTAWGYSNLGYAALGRIIEVVSGKLYDHFLSEKLFQPLGMKDTTFFPNATQKARVAALYTDEGGKLVRAVATEKSSFEAKIPRPEGGLFSTAEDMFQFNQMMLNKGTLRGHRVLSTSAVELMASSFTGDLKTGFAPGVGHGLGYEVVRNVQSAVRYNSVGSIVKGGAYRTYEFVDFEKSLVGVLMMQRTNGGGDVADEINAFLAMSAAAIEK
ncbi:MAG: class A beta-lactamase-related serine hydrolase [Pedosphaera sp.]|nr:class A beta-lactamase-related serine hydrolase [Pedosphaera sp.]